MLISSLFAVALAATPATPAAPAASAKPKPSNLVVAPCEFGEAYQFSTAECMIELHNIGKNPIVLSNLSAARPTDSLSSKNLVVPAGGYAHLEARIGILAEEGISKFYFRFSTDEPGQTQRNAEVKGFVSSVLDQTSPLMDFGIVQADKGGATQSITLGSRAIADFRITGVDEKPSYLDVSIGDDRRTIRATYKPRAPLGPRQTDYIKLSINTPEQPHAWVKLKADVHGDVLPAANPFALGLMRTSDTNEYLIRLSSRSGKDFRIGKIDVERMKAVVEVVSCAPASIGCRMLRVTVPNDQPTGQIGGILKVELPDSGETLPVFIWGMLLDPSVKVVDFDEAAQEAQNAQKESKSPSSAPLNVSSALKLATRDADVPAPPGTGPLIKWSATNEQLVYGYAIYRASMESGPFVRMNPESIVVRQTDGSGSKYQWRDSSAKAGVTYWYYVGLLNRDGSKKPLSTPQKILAK